MCSLAVTPAIATERLRLRRPRPADAPRMAKYAADYDVASMLTRMPHPYTLSHAEEWLATLSDPLAMDKAVFAIDADCEGLVGMLGFHLNEDRTTELGYWIGKPFWGRGYATEAARAGLAWARSDWGRKVIHAGHFTDNPSSGAVLVKSGFLYTGQVEKKHSLARGGEADLRRMVWLA